MPRLSVTMPSDRELRITREFNAPRALVFEAWTKPEYIRRFLLGPPGWEMTTCDVDLRVGGKYRYEWKKDSGTAMGLGGAFREVKAPERIVATEKFDEAWYPGEGLVTNVLTEANGKTTCAITILYESKQARDIAAASPMDQGMEMGFERLDELLAGLQ